MLSRISARYFLLALMLSLLASQAQAGPKLQKLKEDLKRLQKGTLLVAPVLPDLFVLDRLEGKPEKKAAYLEKIAKANTHMQAAVKAQYHFSDVLFLPPAADYQQYFAQLEPYSAPEYFVLQFGQAVQFAGEKPKRIKAYDRQFLGIFEADAQRRVFLNAGKVANFHNAEYAQNIIRSLNRHLETYAKEKKRKGSEPELLIPSLDGQVALLPREALHGSDSTTFQNQDWQTVVTVKPTTLYRVFGGKARPNGTFAGTQPVRDTLKVREELAILPSWGNNFSFEALIEVPVATKMQIGIAAAQPPLKGGGDQVILPYQWPVEWIKEVHSLKTKESWSLEEFKKAYPEYFSSR